MILATTATAQLGGFEVVPIQELAQFSKPDPIGWWGREIQINNKKDLVKSLSKTLSSTPKLYQFESYLRSWFTGLRERMDGAPKKPVPGSKDQDEIVEFMRIHPETLPYVAGLVLSQPTAFSKDVQLTPEEITVIKGTWDLIVRKINSHPNAKTETVRGEYQTMYNNLMNRQGS